MEAFHLMTIHLTLLLPFGRDGPSPSNLEGIITMAFRTTSLLEEVGAKMNIMYTIGVNEAIPR